MNADPLVLSVPTHPSDLRLNLLHICTHHMMSAPAFDEDNADVFESMNQLADLQTALISERRGSLAWFETLQMIDSLCDTGGACFAEAKAWADNRK
jgi:hypothetical protein